MPLPITALSEVCRAIADFVSTGLNASAHSTRIMIGNPTDAAPGQSDTDHRLNLFFYLIEPSGFFPHTKPGETWWLRLHCLITGFGVAEDNISAGENDLRLLGEVIRLFHENPVLDNLKVNEESFQLQVIFQALTPDDLNHIWSTQGEVSYRPSVAYELSLVPIIPAKPWAGSPLVGSLGYQVRADKQTRTAPFRGQVFSPPVSVTAIDASREDWTPAICLIHQGACIQSLALARNSAELNNLQPRVWIAGEVGAEMTLVWEKWTSTQGWQRQSEVTEAAASILVMDPEKASEAVTTSLAHPFKPQEVGQAVLYAERTYVRPVDGHSVTLRSNPVLLIVYPETP
ncbi:MAG: DUF4255 domain-containing protein [Thermodesulfobacteriota bacterium]